MRKFFGQKSKGQIDENLLIKIRKELEDAYSRPVSHHLSEKVFMSRADALRILTRERVGSLFRRLHWYDEDERDVLHPGMCLVICTLITGNFDDWENFRRIFYRPDLYPRSHWLTDEDLPLHNAPILPSAIRQSFERQQYNFLPIVITKDTHAEYDVRMRLPILAEEKLPTSGAQGEVDKVTIAKGFLQYDSRTHNFMSRVMARKRITTETRRGQQSFNTEKFNLEQFKHSLLNHSNIMQSFATFVHGPDFVIISEYAEGQDLHQFLYHPDVVFEDYTSRSMRFTPHNLFSEAFGLAGALNFLHHQMGNHRGAKYQCAHLDLKPENVLVCISDSDRPSHLPVGRWKITDFGLSNVEESVAGRNVVPTAPEAEHAAGLAPGRLLGERSLHPLKRGPGPFQPPEVRDSETAKVSTRRDVWSFGCILAMILAYALGGPEQVFVQHQCRSQGADDYFYIRNKNPFRRTGLDANDAEVKPAIRHWLEVTAPNIAPSHAVWIHHCSRLVLRLLEVDVINRPEINQAVTDLESLLVYTGGQGQYRVWNFDESTLAPEPVPIIPEPVPVVVDTTSAVQSGPFVGVRTNSSPSSTPLQSSPSRGTLSISNWVKTDEASRFIRLRTVQSCENATLCPTGLLAAFWSTSSIVVYDLSHAGDQSHLWADVPPKEGTFSEDLYRHTYSINLLRYHECDKVVLNGDYLAILERPRQSVYALHLHCRAQSPNESSIFYKACWSEEFSMMPHEVKLSPKGFCLVRFTNCLRLITAKGLLDINISDREVVGFDFSGDGGAFCLWVRDRNKRCHTWSVWNSNLKAIGLPVSAVYEANDNLLLSEDAFLAPFYGYPRFVACDKHGNIFLVCADSTRDRARRLGYTERVFAGLMLPGDDAFLLIRMSHKKQKLQRIQLTSMGDRASFKPDDCGPLPNYLRRGVCGISIRSFTGEEGSVCIVTLSPSGLLTRKILY